MTNIYHSNGQVAWTDSVAYHVNGNQAWTTQGIAYHDNRQIAWTGSVAYHANGNLAWQNNHSYDKKGNIISVNAEKLDVDLGPTLRITVSGKGADLFLNGKKMASAQAYGSF